MGKRSTIPAVGAAALLVLAAGAVFVLRGPNESGAQRQVKAYLQRWERGEWAAMRELAHEPPAEFQETHEAMTRALRVTSRRLTAGPVRTDGGGGRASFTARLELGGLGTWEYDGALDLVHSDGTWLVQWSRAALHPKLAAGQHFERTRQWPERAAILAADGTPITTAAPVVRVGIEPRRVRDRTALKVALQQHAGVDPARVDALLDRPGLRPDVFVPVIDLREERYAAVRGQLQPVPGLVFRRETARLTPSEGFARHTVGRIGDVTAERLKELGEPYLTGDEVGLSGLEAARERELAGRPSGEVRIEADGTDQLVETLMRFEGAPGAALPTTLDSRVQTAAERALDGVTKPAAVVAVDITTGAVRAVASRPLDEAFNRALAGRYPPGSTFKMVTTTALLANGTTPASPVTCPPQATVGGKPFRNFEGESADTIPFRQAFAHSCNTAFVQLADRLPDDQLGAAAKAYGFDRELRLPVAAVGGSFPAPSDDAERAAAAIGQGRVTASPLHMATVAAAAAGGTWRAPSLVPNQGEQETSQAMEPSAVTAVRAMMREVVTAGIGTSAAVPRREVAGKTGTAEFGTDVPPKTHAWFAGFEGNLAFAVLIEGGGVGGRDAAPVAARFVSALPR
ncbi:MAG TPA: penicillin-binding transpeptidase domain-containing protein [Acidimicrobiales bacterium]|nr:penicillin-binding transpeptidase domain-containing protein [Acidimicrobiales bacterium]